MSGTRTKSLWLIVSRYTSEVKYPHDWQCEDSFESSYRCRFIEAEDKPYVLSKKPRGECIANTFVIEDQENLVIKVDGYIKIATNFFEEGILDFVAQRKLEKRLNEAKSGLDPQAILGIVMDIQKKENIKRKEKATSSKDNLWSFSLFRRAEVKQNKDEKRLSFFSIGF